jgi:hypothetical protein
MKRLGTGIFKFVTAFRFIHFLSRSEGSLKMHVVDIRVKTAIEGKEVLPIIPHATAPVFEITSLK